MLTYNSPTCQLSLKLLWVGVGGYLIPVITPIAVPLLLPVECLMKQQQQKKLENLKQSSFESHVCSTYVWHVSFCHIVMDSYFTLPGVICVFLSLTKKKDGGSNWPIEKLSHWSMASCSSKPFGLCPVACGEHYAKKGSPGFNQFHLHNYPSRAVLLLCFV